MNNPTPFAPAWWSIELPRHRPCDGTYCYFDYASIPPLPSENLRGDFNWLMPLEPQLDNQMELYRPSEEQRDRAAKNLKLVNAAALELGLRLPAPFTRFMSDLTMQNRIPSSTACYFDMADRFVPSPAGDDGYLLRFLNDQQDVLLWYLYLNRAGAHAIVVSAYYYSAEPIKDDIRQAVINNTWFCGESFEEFIYRFWLENKIWFTLAEGEGELTPEMQSYLKHYPTADA